MKQNNKTNIELESIKNQYFLTQSDIAAMLSVSVDLIKSYLCDPHSARHQIVPDGRINHLKLIIQSNRGKK